MTGYLGLFVYWFAWIHEITWTWFEWTLRISSWNMQRDRVDWQNNANRRFFHGRKSKNIEESWCLNSSLNFWYEYMNRKKCLPFAWCARFWRVEMSLTEETLSRRRRCSSPLLSVAASRVHSHVPTSNGLRISSTFTTVLSLICEKKPSRWNYFLSFEMIFIFLGNPPLKPMQ